VPLILGSNNRSFPFPILPLLGNKGDSEKWLKEGESKPRRDVGSETIRILVKVGGEGKGDWGRAVI